MSTEYHTMIWRAAMNDAEQRVMRLTATIEGGRKKGESLGDYVARVRYLQDVAIKQWETATAEFRNASRSIRESGTSLTDTLVDGVPPEHWADGD
jgi:hypothetical protein